MEVLEVLKGIALGSEGIPEWLDIKSFPVDQPENFINDSIFSFGKDSTFLYKVDTRIHQAVSIQFPLATFTHWADVFEKELGSTVDLSEYQDDDTE
jgi:hypothetical protein